MKKIALGLVILLAGCAASKTTGESGAGAPTGHDYTFAFLLAGTRAGDIDEQTVAEASAGHRAHIEALGAEGDLLLAGPFGEPRANDRWRGIYILDSPDMNVAHELAHADPAVVAGLFELELLPWRSDVDLNPMRALLEQEKAAGMPFMPAAYVLAIGEPGAASREVLDHLEGKGRIICAGELGGARDGQVLMLLTTETVEEARAWLESDGPQVSWELSSLWAAALLGDLAEGE